MVAAPYSEAEIGLMDQAIAAMTRKCCRLPKGFPGAGIHRPITEGGMGISSLMMEYTQITAATLTRALNDQEKLGCITRALLPIQSALLGDTKAGDLPHMATRYTSIMRQLQIMHKADIKIHKDEEDVTDTYMPMLTKLSAMGGGVQIPPRVLYSLHQLGITDHTQLVNQKGTHIISSLDLQNLYGTAVRDCHKLAL
jgi:hypothetical protein